MRQTTLDRLVLLLVSTMCFCVSVAQAQVQGSFRKQIANGDGMVKAESMRAEAQANNALQINGWTVTISSGPGYVSAVAAEWFDVPYYTDLPSVSFTFSISGLDQPGYSGGNTAADYAAWQAQNPPPPGGYTAILDELDVNYLYNMNSPHANPPCAVTVALDGAVVTTIPISCAAPPDTNLGCTGCGGGEPIDFATGNVYIAENDFAFPGRGGGMRLDRSWNSLYSEANETVSGGVVPIGMFGNGWTSSYEENLELSENNGNVYYHRADGSVWTFLPVSNGVYSLTRPQTSVATLTSSPASSPGYWVLALTSGEKRYFDTTFGLLRLIEDRNHNMTTVLRDATNRIVRVTDPVGRSLYFNYGTSTTLGLVTSVTSDAGLSTSYQYDSNSNLIQMTKTDGSSIIFENGNDDPSAGYNMIVAVYDGQGKLLESHSYLEFGGGVGASSSRANGVEALTVSY